MAAVRNVVIFKDATPKRLHTLYTHIIEVMRSGVSGLKKLKSRDEVRREYGRRIEKNWKAGNQG